MAEFRSLLLVSQKIEGQVAININTASDFHKKKYGKKTNICVNLV